MQKTKENKLKKQILFLLFVALFILANSLFAQRKSIEERLEHLTEELNLSEEQQESIKSILEEAREKAEFLRENNTGDRRTIMQEIRNIMVDSNNKIRQELNEDQIERFDEIVEKQKSKMKDRYKGRRR